MDRRSFLHPTAIKEAFSDPGEVPDSPSFDVSPPSRTSPQLVTFSQKAMGTHFEWTFPYGNPQAPALAQQAFLLVDQLEECLTVYRESSEVSRLNRQGHLEGGCLVSPILWDLIDLSRHLETATGGAFDPTFGDLVKAWGFVKGPFRVPSSDEIEEILAQGGMKQVEFDSQRRQVRHRGNRVAWNFGAIGKGFALDCTVRWLERRGGLGAFFLHSGRSSVYAKGSSPAEEAGWVVQLNHPVSQTPLAKVRLMDGALGTSAATYRHFEVDGKTYGHILDPRLGYPAETLLSATVLAPQSAVADALSTAVFVSGVDLAEKLVEENPELGFFLVEKDTPHPRVLGRLQDLMLET